MSKQTKAKSLGRPSKYKPEYCEQIVTALRAGKTLKQFGTEIGVHVDTIHEWRKEHPDFSDAYKLAKQAGEAFYESLGQRGMTGKLPGYNSTTWVFWMKACFKWNDQGIADSDEDADEERLEFYS